MLDDDYKLSHPDLQDWFNREVSSENEGILLPPPEEPPKMTSNLLTSSREERKSEHKRSVVIKLPPKRLKLSSDLTAKQVVDCKSFLLVQLMYVLTIVTSNTRFVFCDIQRSVPVSHSRNVERQ